MPLRSSSAMPQKARTSAPTSRSFTHGGMEARAVPTGPTAGSVVFGTEDCPAANDAARDAAVTERNARRSQGALECIGVRGSRKPAVPGWETVSAGCERPWIERCLLRSETKSLVHDDSRARTVFGRLPYSRI